jgi:hypothetical protein
LFKEFYCVFPKQKRNLAAVASKGWAGEKTGYGGKAYARCLLPLSPISRITIKQLIMN